jgi:hypothetical protein
VIVYSLVLRISKYSCLFFWYCCSQQMPSVGLGCRVLEPVNSSISRPVSQSVSTHATNAKWIPLGKEIGQNNALGGTLVNDSCQRL